MTVRTQHRPLWQRSVQAFRDFRLRLRQPSIAAKCHVEVVLPVSCHYDSGLVLGYAFAIGLSATFAWFAFQMSAAFVGLVKERLVAFGYSGERAALVLLQLSVIPENELPSSCFRERNILCRQSKAVFLLMCKAADILSSDFCSDIRRIYAFTSPFLWSFCCHVPVYSVKVLPQSLHLKRCVPWSLPKR